MQYVQRDVMDDQFLAEMNNFGHIKGYPAPNIIHASPQRNEFSALRRLGIHQANTRPRVHRPHKCLISTLQVPKWSFDATTEEAESWKITPGEQMHDPQIRFIRESYTNSKEDQETWSRQRMRSAREHALTYVLNINGLVYRFTKYGPQVLVPRQRCFALVHA
eukprot:4737707-Pleurochrysis_carterae.AAC.1